MIPRPILGGDSNLLSARIYSAEVYSPFLEEEAITLTVVAPLEIKILIPMCPIS